MNLNLNLEGLVAQACLVLKQQFHFSPVGLNIFKTWAVNSVIIYIGLNVKHAKDRARVAVEINYFKL